MKTWQWGDIFVLLMLKLLQFGCLEGGCRSFVSLFWADSLGYTWGHSLTPLQHTHSTLAYIVLTYGWMDSQQRPHSDKDVVEKKCRICGLSWHIVIVLTDDCFKGQMNTLFLMQFSVLFKHKFMNKSAQASTLIWIRAFTKHWQILVTKSFCILVVSLPHFYLPIHKVSHFLCI